MRAPQIAAGGRLRSALAGRRRLLRRLALALGDLAVALRGGAALGLRSVRRADAGGIAAALTAVGDIPPGALEDDAGRVDHAPHGLAAFGALGDRRVTETLHALEVVA